jgi:hypothetical protein
MMLVEEMSEGVRVMQTGGRDRERRTPRVVTAKATSITNLNTQYT